MSHRDMEAEYANHRLEVSAEIASAFIHGWLTHFAFAEGLPTLSLTARVSELLAGETGRDRRPDRLPSLPPSSTRSAVRVQQVEVGKHAHRAGPSKGARTKAGHAPKMKAERHMSAKGRAAIRRGIKARWAATKRAGKTRLVAGEIPQALAS